MLDDLACALLICSLVYCGVDTSIWKATKIQALAAYCVSFLGRFATIGMEAGRQDHRGQSAAATTASPHFASLRHRSTSEIAADLISGELIAVSGNECMEMYVCVYVLHVLYLSHLVIQPGNHLPRRQITRSPPSAPPAHAGARPTLHWCDHPAG